MLCVRLDPALLRGEDAKRSNLSPRPKHCQESLWCDFLLSTVRMAGTDTPFAIRNHYALHLCILCGGGTLGQVNHVPGKALEVQVVEIQ